MLTTLAKAKKYLHISDNSFDDDLTLTLQAASQAIELYCKRTFKKENYTELHSGNDVNLLVLRNYPIHQVTEATIDSVVVSDITVVGKDLLFRANGWSKGDYNIQIKYTAGYVTPEEETESNPRTLPEAIELACILYAQTLMRTPDVVAERIGDISVNYSTSNTPLPQAVKSLIDPYVGVLL